jgi:TetR/AcrR family acrAB operon transcriptional repressor
MVRRTKEEAQETRAQIIEAAEKAFYKRGVAREPPWPTSPNWRE